MKARKFRLNTFDLPHDIFERLWETPGWELMLWRVVLRAKERGHSTLELGMDAAYEKARVGARVRPQCAYDVLATSTSRT